MHTYFHGWRRKTGVVTLVLACVLMGGWMRSTFLTDELGIPTWNHRGAALMSSGQSLLWITQDTNAATTGDYPLDWMTVDSSDNLMNIEEIKWSWRQGGFGVGEWSWLERGDTSQEGYRVTQTYRAFPYWCITIPLTLLSAYLILVPSRKRPARNPDA